MGGSCDGDGVEDNVFISLVEETVGVGWERDVDTVAVQSGDAESSVFVTSWD